MWRVTLRAGLACLVLLIASVVSGPLWAQSGGKRDGDHQADENGWLSSLEQGQALAKETNKPLMLVFRCLP